MPKIKTFKALKFLCVDNIFKCFYSNLSSLQKQDYILKYLKNNQLVQDKEETIYVYEQKFDLNNKSCVLRSIICNIKVEEFWKGNIVPLEDVIQKHSDEMLNFINKIGCDFKPVYAFYKSNKNSKVQSIIKKICKKAEDIHIKDANNVSHKLWSIKAKSNIDMIQGFFAHRKLYIADGHHRYSAHLSLKNHVTDYIMMAVIDVDNYRPIILPTHRIVKNIKNFELNDFIEELSKYFFIEKFFDFSLAYQKYSDILKKNFKPLLILAPQDKFFILKLKNSDALNNESIDVSILQDVVFKKILNMDTCHLYENTVDYVHDIKKALDSLEVENVNFVAILNEPNFEEFFKLISKGIKFPEKFTCFYPKPLSGILLNKF